MSVNRPLTFAAGCGTALLVLAGCGGDDDPTSDSSTTVAAVTAPVVPSPPSSVAVTTATLATSIPAATIAPTTTAHDDGTTVAPATTAHVDTTVVGPTTTAASRVVSSPSDNVRRGDTGPGVEQIQTALNAAGYDLEVDGIFGPQTDRAVRDYQTKNGLTVDGIVGNMTWGKLSSAAATTTTA